MASAWTGPIEMNVEHKKFFTGGLGPKTSEMGTLMWFDDNEQNRLFTETLGRLKPWLRESGFKGDIDINCIINKKGVCFLLRLRQGSATRPCMAPAPLSVRPLANF